MGKYLTMTVRTLVLPSLQPRPVLVHDNQSKVPPGHMIIHK